MSVGTGAGGCDSITHPYPLTDPYGCTYYVSNTSSLAPLRRTLSHYVVRTTATHGAIDVVRTTATHVKLQSVAALQKVCFSILALCRFELFLKFRAGF